MIWYDENDTPYIKRNKPYSFISAGLIMCTMAWKKVVYIEASESKWVNPVLYTIGVNSLRLEGLHINYNTKTWHSDLFNVYLVKINDRKPVQMKIDKSCYICTVFNSC